MKISGYLTVKNAVKMDYPFEQSIKSLLDFCDEVVVIDSSNEKDGTQDKLQNLMNVYKHLYVYHVDLDWTTPNHGIYDGQLKALARSKCTGDYLFQLDADEIVEPNVRFKIERILQEAAPHMDKVPVIALPVVEYWGSKGKIRIDVNLWKFRLSKNLPNVTHGIPVQLRKYENGLLYSKPGSDGCHYIDKNSGQMVPYSNFITPQIEQIRQKALQDNNAVMQYANWANMVTTQLPVVYHFSWYSIAAKILKYKYFWNNSWLSLYNEKKPEGWNPFFNDRTLEQVSDEEIKQLAIKLEQKTGGHVFHSSWQGQKINHMKLNISIPEIMKEWCKNHQDY